MNTSKKFDSIFTIVLFVAAVIFGLWLSAGDIWEVVASFGSTILKFLGCFTLFAIICILFPKSWFAKIFKNKL